MHNVYFLQGATLTEQYADAGRIHRDHIQRAATKNRRKWSTAHALRRSILERIHTRLTTELQFGEFYACLTAWAQGAEISIADALELLDDNTGCQSAIGRYANGVVLLHTEEELTDITERMTPPQVLGFRAGGDTLYTLVYNNMLPGAAVYGWTETYAVAVDSLFLNEDGVDKLQRPILANIVSWLLWRNVQHDMRAQTTLSLVRDAGTCVDGYAVNIVYRDGSAAEGYKITFARDSAEMEKLPHITGGSLRQLNIIDPAYVEHNRPIARYRMPYRRFYRGYWNYYKERLRMIDADIRTYSRFLYGEVMDKKETQRKILQELTGPLSSHYINEVVGAVCVTLIDKNESSTAIGLVENEKLKYIVSL